MIDLDDVRVRPTKQADGLWHVYFGVYLPDITPEKGYTVHVRLVHEADELRRTEEPADFRLSWQPGHRLGLWCVEAVLDPKLAPSSDSCFGRTGQYLYRFQLCRHGQTAGFWFTDPFGLRTARGGHSAFVLSDEPDDFAWTDSGFKVPRLDDLIVYELHVGEFNKTFDGVRAQLDYLTGLGVNALELMPVTDVKEEIQWGYTPLGYFAPDERYGGPEGLKKLVDACHARGIAVIFDAVYAHAHREFCYNLVYIATGEPNPFMGPFADQFSDLGSVDYDKEFARNFFLEVNKHWMEVYHGDGFRYDFVPGLYDGPTGVGYSKLLYDTYQHSRAIDRFRDPAGHSRIIQVAEYVGEERYPRDMLKWTYSNTCWQYDLAVKTRKMAEHCDNRPRFGDHLKDFALLLDPCIDGYPREHRDGGPDVFPVAPFQFFESHDKTRFINAFGETPYKDGVDLPYGDRNRAHKLRPYVIALYTAKGIPMLWQAQEIVENWERPEDPPGGSDYRRVLVERPVHWEYLYDPIGREMIDLYRSMAAIRHGNRALKARGEFFYDHEEPHLAKRVIVFHRSAPADGKAAEEQLMIALNFGDTDAAVSARFRTPGRWVDALAPESPAVTTVRHDEQRDVTIPANFGRVYVREAAGDATDRPRS